MITVHLVPHDKQYARHMYRIMRDPEVTEHLSFNMTSTEDAIRYIRQVQQEEREGKTISRAILDENREFVGSISLMKINLNTGQAHLGTWLDKRVWGKGYNRLAKQEILKIAFLKLNLRRIFVGVRRANKRSIRAQEKLGYVTMDAGKQYPVQLETMEKREQCPVMLNVIYRHDFLNHFLQNVSQKRKVNHHV
ncbi:MAG: GNAT family N-acetyltransferase [Bacillaceae bacterium]|nr:GNAT family N-acetyltransferase [Bacillaceae bacterium]